MHAQAHALVGDFVNLHGLREILPFANKGTLRKKQAEELESQAGCLNLVTNAVVTWTRSTWPP